MIYGVTAVKLPVADLGAGDGCKDSEGSEDLHFVLYLGILCQMMKMITYSHTSRYMDRYLPCLMGILE